MPEPRRPAGALVVGVDLGTLSGRAVVVRVEDGAELGTATHDYAHGVLTDALPDGTPLRPDWALQVPDDWLEVLRSAVPAALAAAAAAPADVVGIGVAATSCTMVPATADGTPLHELTEYAAEPHAHATLWKHHAAQPQADRITDLATRRGEPWLRRYGGRVSSESQLAKGLHLVEESPAVAAAATRYVEAADWVVWRLCGAYVRSASAAGYKGLRQDGAGPPADFLTELHPDLPDLVAKVEGPTAPLGAAAGRLTAEAAAWTGLPEGIAVAVGSIDAHATAPAAGATGPGRMVAILGTSTCLVVNGEELREVPGMSGAVDGGITPGLWGYEAGQSGTGDVLDWFVATGVPGGYAEEAAARGLTVHRLLAEKAAAQPVGAHGLVALDWHGGNRSVLMDHELSGLLVGQTLATRPEDVYRALVEATAFGARTIVEAYTAAGIAVEELVVTGGLVRNPLVMRVYADVLDLPLTPLRSEHGSALGAAVHAAVAAGAHPDLHVAAAAMGAVGDTTWRPDPTAVAAYRDLYDEYRTLHDHFGRGGSDVMRRLRALRRRARSGAAGAGGDPGGDPDGGRR